MTKRRSPRARSGVNREDFINVVQSLDRVRLDLERCRLDLDIQFKRTAQVQAELEELQRAMKRLGAGKTL